MKLDELFDLIKSKLEEKYGKFQNGGIYDFGILILSQSEPGIWRQSREEEIVVEKNNIRVRIKVDLSIDSNGKYFAQIFISDIEIESLC